MVRSGNNIQDSAVLSKNGSVLLKPVRYLINIIIVITVVVALVNWEIFRYLIKW